MNGTNGDIKSTGFGEGVIALLVLIAFFSVGVPWFINTFRQATDVNSAGIYVTRLTNPYGGFAKYRVDLISGEETIQLPNGKLMIYYSRDEKRITAIARSSSMMYFLKDGQVKIQNLKTKGEVIVPMDAEIQKTYDEALVLRDERWQRYGHLLYDI